MLVGCWVVQKITVGAVPEDGPGRAVAKTVAVLGAGSFDTNS